MLDIDNFKSINDRFGHDVGDTVLRKIADILVENTRAVDTVGRLGGEEFLIICPETGAMQGKFVAEKIRRAVEKLNLDRIPEVTVSIGVADFTGMESVEELIKKADDALYTAKRTGKNRVVIYSETKKPAPEGQARKQHTKSSRTVGFI